VAVTLHRGDLPAGLRLGDIVAIDTETMGLAPARDRLCLVQLSNGDGNAHVVQLRRGEYRAPNLRALLADAKVTKLFHFARFDVAALRFYLGVLASPIWCTKIASKLARTYTDRHGLKDLCKELLGVELSKQVQSSDWGAEALTEEQISYAGADVIYLHRLKAELERMLGRENRLHLAQAAFAFLPLRSELDLGGWGDVDIFAH
jgi:ribonuclease D